jgi:hypothetical protein
MAVLSPKPMTRIAIVDTEDKFSGGFRLDLMAVSSFLKVDRGGGGGWRESSDDDLPEKGSAKSTSIDWFLSSLNLLPSLLCSNLITPKGDVDDKSDRNLS